MISRIISRPRGCLNALRCASIFRSPLCPPADSPLRGCRPSPRREGGDQGGAGGEDRVPGPLLRGPRRPRGLPAPVLLSNPSTSRFASGIPALHSRRRPPPSHSSRPVLGCSLACFPGSTPDFILIPVTHFHEQSAGGEVRVSYPDHKPLGAGRTHPSPQEGTRHTETARHRDRRFSPPDGC